MSCHEIGRGMSSLMNDMFGLYDDGKIPKESMFDILEVLKSGTYCCDGNLYETMEYVCHNRCILCLQHKDEEDLVHQYTLSENIEDSELTDELEDFIQKYRDYCVCQTCMRPILLDNKISPERADDLIKKSNISYYD